MIILFAENKFRDAVRWLEINGYVPMTFGYPNSNTQWAKNLDSTQRVRIVGHWKQLRGLQPDELWLLNIDSDCTDQNIRLSMCPERGTLVKWVY